MGNKNGAAGGVRVHATVAATANDTSDSTTTTTTTTTTTVGNRDIGTSTGITSAFDISSSSSSTTDADAGDDDDDDDSKEGMVRVRSSARLCIETNDCATTTSSNTGCLRSLHLRRLVVAAAAAAAAVLVVCYCCCCYYCCRTHSLPLNTTRTFFLRTATSYNDNNNNNNNNKETIAITSTTRITGTTKSRYEDNPTPETSFDTPIIGRSKQRKGDRTELVSQQSISSRSSSSSSSSSSTRFQGRRYEYEDKYEYEPRCNNNRNNKNENEHHRYHGYSDDYNYNYNYYEAPEPFRYLHDCCNDCNPPVEESPDPLVSMTWTRSRTTTWNKKKTNLKNDRATTTTNKYDNNDENDDDDDTNQDNNGGDDDDDEAFVGIPLQIYRTRTPVKQWTIPSEGCLITTRTEREDDETVEDEEDLAVSQSHSPLVATTTATKQRELVSRNKPKQPKATTSTSTTTATFGTIVSNCTIVMDWGSERAAWFEISSRDDLTTNNKNNVKVTASISEYNRPYPGKTRLELTKYGNHTYRLETNKELYEGIRFTFLHVEFLENENANKNSNAVVTGTIGIAIDDVSIVSKIKPIQYTGSFRSSNRLLTKAFYWGAYGVRLNVEQSQLNSVLIERGDRVAIQGDGHPTIATVLEVFYSHETKHLLKNVLNATDNAHKHVVDDSIMAYPLYWCLSAMEYYWATYTHTDSTTSTRNKGSKGTGDYDFVRQVLVNDISLLLDKRIQDFLDPNLDITWFGWDDRVGNGWCFHSKNDVCTREGLLSFAGLVIRVCNDFVNLLLSLDLHDPGMNTSTRSKDAQLSNMVERYKKESKRMTQALRQVPEYPSGFGVHSAANVINAFVATPEEIQQHWMGTTDGTNTLNDAVTICSFSQFNQYWILQAYGNMGGGLEHALKSIELCWGPMMELSTGGCFWEMSSPEWLRFIKEGDQAPHLPSYCHPWASGVTPWLSKLLGGLNALLPGYKEFVAMPYVSVNYPSVATTTATPHGPVSVSARLSPFDMTSTSTSGARSNEDCGGATQCGRKKDGSKERLLQSPLVSRYEFDATIRSNVPGIFGIRRTMVSNVSSLSSNLSLEIDSLGINGVPVTASEIIDTERATMHLGHISRQRLREHIFVRLEGQYGSSGNVNSIIDGDLYAITATYGHAEDNPGAEEKNARTHSKSIGESKEGDAVAFESQDQSGSINSVSPFPLPQYPATIDEAFDRESQGDGLLVYGKDGYVLLGCNVSNLPAYVSNVTVRRHGYPGWVIPDQELVGYSDTDPVYLPLKDGQNTTRGKRVLGRLGLDDTGGGDINCILVDMEIFAGNDDNKDDGKGNFGSAPPQKPYSLSIYFVATGNESRHAIRVMDGTTFNVIAPTTLVEDYAGGIWWTLHYDRSVRLKMMDIKGIHLSAIAFTTDLSRSDVYT